MKSILRILLVLFAFTLLIGCSGLSQSQFSQHSDSQASPAASAASTGTPKPHVVLIIEENRSYSSVYPAGMPWLSQVGDQYGMATNYYSDQSGSLLDYLWLSSGSSETTSGCSGGGCSKIIYSNNIFRQLNQAGLSWKVYAESMPYAGFMGSSYGNYVKRHNPAAWYSDVINHSAQQKKMVPFTQFATDLAAGNLPSYSVIVPNLVHDAHSGSMSAADTWLKQNIKPLLNSSYFAVGGNSVMFITFDNGNGDAQGQVLTTVIGPTVLPGVKVGKHFRHENTLKTMMQFLGLTVFPGASASAAPMSEFF